MKKIIILSLIIPSILSALTKEEYFQNCLTEYGKKDYVKSEEVCRSAFANLQRPKGVKEKEATAYSQYYMYMSQIHQATSIKSLNTIKVSRTMKEQAYDAKYAAIRGEINNERDYHPEAHRKSLGFLVEAERLFKLFQMNQFKIENPYHSKEIAEKDLYTINLQELSQEDLSEDQIKLLNSIIHELKESIRFARTVGFDNQISEAQLEYIESFKALKNE